MVPVRDLIEIETESEKSAFQKGFQNQSYFAIQVKKLRIYREVGKTLERKTSSSSELRIFLWKNFIIFLVGKWFKNCFSSTYEVISNEVFQPPVVCLAKCTGSWK